MGTRRRVPLAILGIALATTAMSGTNRRMYPNLTIFRGGALHGPVALQHCCVQTVTINGRSGASLTADTLAMIYEGLTAATPSQLPADTMDATSYTEVAEFLGTAPLPVSAQSMVSTVRRPDLDTLFGRATHYSRIYPGTNDTPPLWKTPVVTSDFVSHTYYLIGPEAQKILASLGIRLK